MIDDWLPHCCFNWPNSLIAKMIIEMIHRDQWSREWFWISLDCKKQHLLAILEWIHFWDKYFSEPWWNQKTREKNGFGVHERIPHKSRKKITFTCCFLMLWQSWFLIGCHPVTVLVTYGRKNCFCLDKKIHDDRNEIAFYLGPEPPSTRTDGLELE